MCLVLTSAKFYLLSDVLNVKNLSLLKFNLFYFVFYVKSSLFCIFRVMVYVNDPLLIKLNYNLLLMTQTLKGKR